PGITRVLIVLELGATCGSHLNFVDKNWSRLLRECHRDQEEYSVRLSKRSFPKPRSQEPRDRKQAGVILEKGFACCQPSYKGKGQPQPDAASRSAEYT